MDQSEDPRELERKIDQATRIASGINDQMTVERLTAWIEELRQRLQQPWRRSKSRTAGSAPGGLGQAPRHGLQLRQAP